MTLMKKHLAHQKFAQMKEDVRAAEFEWTMTLQIVKYRAIKDKKRLRLLP